MMTMIMTSINVMIFLFFNINYYNLFTLFILSRTSGTSLSLVGRSWTYITYWLVFVLLFNLSECMTVQKALLANELVLVIIRSFNMFFLFNKFTNHLLIHEFLTTFLITLINFGFYRFLTR
jgi:hypothetical protein